MLTRHLHFFSIVLVLSHYCSIVVGQTVEDTAAAGNSFVKIEKEAYYRGGEKAWMQYIADNLELKRIKKKAPAGKYTVIIQFIIATDGSIAEVEPLTALGYGIEEEAVRVIKSSPALWVPAEQDGKKVKVYRKQPITLQIGDKEKK